MIWLLLIGCVAFVAMLCFCSPEFSATVIVAVVAAVAAVLLVAAKYALYLGFVYLAVIAARLAFHVPLP